MTKTFLRDNNTVSRDLLIIPVTCVLEQKLLLTAYRKSDVSLMKHWNCVAHFRYRLHTYFLTQKWLITVECWSIYFVVVVPVLVILLSLYDRQWNDNKRSDSTAASQVSHSRQSDEICTLWTAATRASRFVLGFRFAQFLHTLIIISRPILHIVLNVKLFFRIVSYRIAKQHTILCEPLELIIINVVPFWSLL